MSTGVYESVCLYVWLEREGKRRKREKHTYIRDRCVFFKRFIALIVRIKLGMAYFICYKPYTFENNLRCLKLSSMTELCLRQDANFNLLYNDG